MTYATAMARMIDVGADGKVVAYAVSICMTLRGEKAAGR